jgi:alpha-tubulin suppressor-like RCC1 family protein
MLIDTTDEIPPPVKVKTKENRFDDDENEVVWEPKRKLRRLLVTGLNQAALCEEPGHETFTEVAWDCDLDPPERMFAGNGISFFITRLGYVYSFGRGHFGVLGHGNTESYHLPRQITSLNRSAIMKIAMGRAHVVALSLDDVLFSWGRNDKGQLGRGFESAYEPSPGPVVFAALTKYKILDLACGAEHTIAWVNITNSNVEDNHKLFAWGDESRGQLGSGDAVSRMRPQENRWFTKFLRKNMISMERILAGGYHNLVLVKYSGQVISWGANEYGQLGNGNQWDDATPKFINNLKDVYEISAGLRHNLCVVKSHSIDVMGWGYNNFGELGLGDTDIRLQPTKITAFKNAQVLQVSCGERHSAVVTSHIPLTAKEDATLKPYFKILEVRWLVSLCY